MRWTAREDSALEQFCGEYPWLWVVKRYNAWAAEAGHVTRSATALMKHAQKLGYNRKASGEYITLGVVSEILGIDREKPRRWVKRGLVRTYRRSQCKPSPYYVSRAALRAWARRDPSFFRCYAHDALVVLFDDTQTADTIHALPFVAARKHRRAVKCVDTGSVYQSVIEAARANYVTTTRISAVINTQERANGRLFVDLVPLYGA